MKHAKRYQTGFTLIELLVVVTIIGILAGLSVPALNKALDSAKRAQAAAMVSSLKVALNAYQADYGAWPEFFDSAAVESYGGSNSEDLYGLLVGKTDASYGNPKGTVYMEFTAKQLYPKGTSMTDAEGFMDPWEGCYSVKVDDDYDNEIDEVPDTNGAGSATIYASMAIWSTGTKSTTGDGGDQRKYITSW
ncbi:MAG: prepilin-type N-terminal cleavage/methylation domain-containing protein [Verrucomicrobiales bacterium]|jgi:prepilin-type N-terminal cleavage/methylation domain-containing protein|nr:prepilin-type N-terminal cleavage/methylation domain-containing protein [Verrucomicrobiales bacterium]